MNTKTLRDLFLDELADMYVAKQRIVKALPKLAQAATCEDLRSALYSHLKETEAHVQKLEAVIQCFGGTAKDETCEATQGLLEKGDEIAAEFQGSPTMNAALIAAAQKVEHYEIASYGCLYEWAGLLGNEKAATLLQEILDEEKATTESLTELARTSSNEEALGESEDEESEDKPETSAKPQPTGRSTNARRKPAETLAR